MYVRDNNLIIKEPLKPPHLTIICIDGNLVLELVGRNSNYYG